MLDDAFSTEAFLLRENPKNEPFRKFADGDCLPAFDRGNDECFELYEKPKKKTYIITPQERYSVKSRRLQVHLGAKVPCSLNMASYVLCE